MRRALAALVVVAAAAFLLWPRAARTPSKAEQAHAVEKPDLPPFLQGATPVVTSTKTTTTATEAAAPRPAATPRTPEEERRALEAAKLAQLSQGNDPPASADDLAFFRRAQRIDSLSNGHTALLRALGEQHPEPARSIAGNDPQLAAWTEAPRAFPGSKMRVHAQLAGSGALQVSSAHAFLTLDGLPQEVPLAADGALGWVADVTVPADLPRRPTQLSATVQLAVTGTRDGAPFELTGGTSFTVNFVEGRLVRLDRARREQGNLVIDAVLDVKLAGRWYVYAELRGPHGEALASARDRVALEPGERRVPLVFVGAALREQGVDGPYTVHLARATRVEELPANETDPVLDALTTPSWLATEFSAGG